MAKQKSIKKTIIRLAVLGAFISLIILALVVAASVFLLMQKNKEQPPDETDEYYEEIEVTGTRKGDNITLKIKFLESGYSISGIKGKVDGKEYKASLKQSKGKRGKSKGAALPGPPARLDFCSWMCYKAVTATGSDQYVLLNSSKAHNGGKDKLFRMYDGRYCVALGSYYAKKIGTKVSITFDKGGKRETIKAVLGDQKSDAHTDATHRYHDPNKTDRAGNKGDGSVVEFIMASSSNYSANSAAANSFGRVVGINGASGISGDVSLSGTIKGTEITVTGTVGDVPIDASGTIKEGKIKATGFAGNYPGSAGTGAIVGKGKLCYPMPTHTSVSSGFGPRWGTTHQGVDFPAPVGTNIVATKDGVAIQVDNNPNQSRGKYVTLDHGGNFYTRYQHNSKNLVRVGQRVRKGDVIAKSGHTGDSTGPHLHFEVLVGGYTGFLVYEVDPLPYLRK